MNQQKKKTTSSEQLGDKSIDSLDDKYSSNHPWKFNFKRIFTQTYSFTL